MSGKRQNIQYSLVSASQERGEAPVGEAPRAEPRVAKPALESPATMEHLMEEVCDREESPECVEARSKEPGQSWRGWDDHRGRYGLPA